MDTTILLLLALVLIVYLVIRQFTEQRVTWRTLLLLPALSVYACYTDLQPAFAHFALLPLLGGLTLGLLVGLGTGIFRGRHTRVRLDDASGVVYSKPQLLSSLLWLGMLLLHIAMVALSYTSLEHLLLTGILIAFTSALFLVTTSTQKLMVFLASNRLQAALPPQPYGWRES